MSTALTAQQIAEQVINSEVAGSIKDEVTKLAESVDQEKLGAALKEISESDRTAESVKAILEEHIGGIGETLSNLQAEYETVVKEMAAEHGVSLEDVKKAIQEKTAENYQREMDQLEAENNPEAPSTTQQEQTEQVAQEQQQQTEQQSAEEKKTQEEKEKQEQEQKDILSALPPEMGAIVAVLFAVMGMAEKLQENAQEQDVAQEQTDRDTARSGAPAPVNPDDLLQADNPQDIQTQQGGDAVPIPGAAGGYIDPNDVEILAQQETDEPNLVPGAAGGYVDLDEVNLPSQDQQSSMTFDLPEGHNFGEILQASDFDLSTAGFSGGTFNFDMQQVNTLDETTLASVPNVGDNTEKFRG